MSESKPLSTQPKLVTPCIDTIDIAQRLAQGELQVDVAIKYNITQQRISQIAKDIKPIIDKYKAILVDKYAPKYIDRTITENDLAHDIASENYTPNEINETFLTRQDKKGDKIMTSIGIYPSHANLNNFGSIQVNQQINANTVVSSSITRLIGDNISEKLQQIASDTEVIDVSADDVST